MTQARTLTCSRKVELRIPGDLLTKVQALAQTTGSSRNQQLVHCIQVGMVLCDAVPSTAPRPPVVVGRPCDPAQADDGMLLLSLGILLQALEQVQVALDAARAHPTLGLDDAWGATLQALLNHYAHVEGLATRLTQAPAH